MTKHATLLQMLSQTRIARVLLEADTTEFAVGNSQQSVLHNKANTNSSLITFARLALHSALESCDNRKLLATTLACSWQV